MPNNWRDKWAGSVRTPEDMIRFIDDVGCCTGKPLSGYPGFPNQVEALGPIASGVPDPWFWKDDLHVEKRLYYTRLFGGQPGFVSNALLPAFVATNGAVFDELVFEGLVSPEIQDIYSVIEMHGPIAIRDLKRALGPDASKAANRVLHDLERQFIIAKAGITGRTRGTYGYVWDLMERWEPNVLSEADRLGRSNARQIVQDHLSRFGIAPGSEFYAKVLGWGNG